MPQLHFYVPDEVAQQLRAKAEAKNLSVSKYIASIVEREVGQGWPTGYFREVAGSWVGDFPDIAELPLEERERLE
ncbi:MAG: hypothetical protein KGZ35_00020 [Truepera sp.]|nr:hypothetical protein [Truepera sp.]